MSEDIFSKILKRLPVKYRDQEPRLFVRDEATRARTLEAYRRAHIPPPKIEIISARPPDNLCLSLKEIPMPCPNMEAAINTAVAAAQEETSKEIVKTLEIPAPVRIVNEGISREDVQKLARIVSHAAPILLGEDAVVPFGFEADVREARAIANNVLAKASAVHLDSAE